MTFQLIRRCTYAALLLSLVSVGTCHGAATGPMASKTAMMLATGQMITPMAAAGTHQQPLNPRFTKYPDFVAGNAVSSQLSPDGKTLAVLTAGQNSLFNADGNVDEAASTQFLFMFDVGRPHQAAPKLRQVIQQRNAHLGLVFAPGGQTLYAAGGVDDQVYVYAKSRLGWNSKGVIQLSHQRKGVGIKVEPNASGLGISADGKTLIVANNYNDSISVIDTATERVRYEHDLRPFFLHNEGVDGGVGGSFPVAVAVRETDWSTYLQTAIARWSLSTSRLPFTGDSSSALPWTETRSEWS